MKVEQTNEREEIVLPYRKIIIINVEGKKQIEISPSEHNNNYCRQNLPMDVKITR